MTIAELKAALKHAGQNHLMLKVQKGADLLRFGTTVGDADTRLFNGRILKIGEIASSLSFRELRYADMSVRVTIANDKHWQDGTVLDFDGANGTIYPWCEGLTNTEIEDFPLFYGEITIESYTESEFSILVTDYVTAKDVQLTDADHSGTNYPSVVLNWVMESLMGLNPARYDLTTIDAYCVGTIRSFINEPISGLALVDRILWQLGAGRSQKWGLWTPVCFDFSGTTTDTLEERYFLGDGGRVSWTPVDLVCSYVRVFFNIDYTAPETFVDEEVWSWLDNTLFAASYAKYGIRGAVVKAVDLATMAIYEEFGDKYANFYSDIHEILEVVVPWHVGLDIFEGDARLITAAVGPGGWVDEEFVLLDRSIGLGGIKQRWFRVATI